MGKDGFQCNSTHNGRRQATDHIAKVATIFESIGSKDRQLDVRSRFQPNRLSATLKQRFQEATNTVAGKELQERLLHFAATTIQSRKTMKVTRTKLRLTTCTRAVKQFCYFFFRLAEFFGDKLERDLKLLLRENDEQPDDPFTLFNLGSVYLEQQKIPEALACLQRSLSRSAPGDSIVRKLFALIVQCQRSLGKYTEARETCRAARRIFPRDAEILFQESLVHRELGDRILAIETLQQAMTQTESPHFASVDTGLRGYKAYHNLAVWYREENHLEDAERHWTAALEDQPTFAPALIGLAEIYFVCSFTFGVALEVGFFRECGEGDLLVW